MSNVSVRVYRNNDVLRVIGLIPQGHIHMRLILVLRDQVIVLQEAAISAIVRAYVNIVGHPTRRAIEYIQVKLSERDKKLGYAEYQLIESGKSEEEIIAEWGRIII
jgi:hypothetical protein